MQGHSQCFRQSKPAFIDTAERRWHTYHRSLASKEKEEKQDYMATLKQLRLRARLTLAQLGRLANVDGKTVKRAEDGIAINEVKAVAIVEALGKVLNKELTIDEVEGLKILGMQ
jgi:hypothetical protein